VKRKIIFFLLISCLSFSQQKSLTIKDLPPKSEDSVFPLISYAVDSRVENKINTFLQVDQLEYIPGSTQTHLSLFLQENFSIPIMFIFIVGKSWKPLKIF
jgi:hypothetical protein